MLKTLLVEDNLHYRGAFKRALMQRFSGLKIMEASSEEDTLDSLLNFCPELVFMDIHLPRGDGLELTKKIKSVSPHIVVVILTQDDAPEYQAAAHESGADYFLSKSVPLARIFKLIESLLSRLHTRH